MSKTSRNSAVVNGATSAPASTRTRTTFKCPSKLATQTGETPSGRGVSAWAPASSTRCLKMCRWPIWLPTQTGDSSRWFPTFESTPGFWHKVLNNIQGPFLAGCPQWRASRIVTAARIE